MTFSNNRPQIVEVVQCLISEDEGKLGKNGMVRIAAYQQGA